MDKIEVIMTEDNFVYLRNRCQDFDMTFDEFLNDILENVRHYDEGYDGDF